MRKSALFVIVAVLFAGIALAKKPGPVIRELGLMSADPGAFAEDRVAHPPDLVADDPEQARRQQRHHLRGDRLRPFGKEGRESVPHRRDGVLLAGRAEEEGGGRAGDEIMRKIRDLEEDLLQYVEIVGPPRERRPVTEQQQAPRP